MLFAVSDIHSYYGPLMVSLNEKGFFERDNNKLIVIGDALDRGPDTKKVIDFLLSLHNEGRLIYIKGNHEDLFVDCLRDISRGDICDIVCGMSHHYINKTFDSILKIADMNSNQAMNFPDELVSRVMESDYYKKLLPTCLDFYETEKYIFTHGYLPMITDGLKPYVKYKYDPNWRTADPIAWRNARWVNGMEVACKHRILEPNKTVVVGHWHTSWGHCFIEKKGSETGKNADFSPFAADGILAIDAYTVRSGIVNCVIFD